MLRSSAQRLGFPMLASVFGGAPSPWRISAGPVGDIVRMSPPSRAGAVVPDAGLCHRGRAVALAGLRRSGQICQPWVFARPRGGHGSRRWPPPSGVRRRLRRSPPVWAETSSVGLRPAAQGPCWRVCADHERLRLSTCTHLGKIVCLISLEIRRPPPVFPETPVSQNGAASA